ncbi:uncharacterized protein [Lolium perenne]|uniref:uncharacterized protein isoform X2 n=1 Tax=Lolium perenne TaxID=4522 RepID=UPI003A9A0DEA
MRAQRRRPPPSPSPGHSGSSAAIRRLPGPPMPCRFCPHLCLEFVFCSRWLVSWWSAFCLCEEAASANDCGKDYPCKMTMCVYLLFSIASRSCCCRWEKHRLALLSPQACLDFFIHGLHRSKSARGVAKEIAVKSCNALLLKVLWLGKPILIVEDCETHESMHGYPRIGWVLPAYLCKVNFTIFIKLDTSRIYNMCPTLAPSFMHETGHLFRRFYFYIA